VPWRDPPRAPEKRITTVDATAYLSPYGHRRVRRPINLRLTEQTYPLEPSIEQSWLPIAFRAFERLARRRPFEHVLIIGTGNGLDALGAVEILRPRSVTVTDLHAESLAVSRENVTAHLVDPNSVALGFHAGDLMSCVPPASSFSLIYENLPNVTSSPDHDLRRGTIGGRFYPAAESTVPEPYARYMLDVHHRLLQQARPRVEHGGGVLTAIGGRMPDDIVFGLHRSCGLRPELAAFDVKLQAEPRLMVTSYSRAESERGVTFRFYAAEAVALVAEHRAAGLDGQPLADAAAPGLELLSMSAAEASTRVERGLPVAHSVLMVFGERSAEE
jgi:methylase of polypeptide subunit release factors